MRNIFLALLLANLAFAAWHVWFSDSPRPVRPDDSDLPPITLVKELPTGDADSQAANSAFNSSTIIGHFAHDAARIGGIVSRQCAEQDGAILHAARHRSHMVKRE